MPRASQPTVIVIVAVVFIGLSMPMANAKTLINKSFFGGVAIEGADPVAYRLQGKRVDGDKGITAEYRGAVWRFASTAHRDLFLANPGKYAPAYGGYCAWAVSQGYIASIDPDAWKVVDGVLYLNYSKGVQRTWERDIEGNIAAANKNWPNIRADLTR